MRNVPACVLDNVLAHLDTLNHLLVTDGSTVDRYARITRIHVYNILRAQTTGTKYARYVRDANYIHHQLTHQMRPDISDLETPLLIMFETRNDMTLAFFFCS